MRDIWGQIEDVSNSISSVQDYNQHASDTCLLETVKYQQEMFLNIASNLSVLHELSENLKEDFIKKFNFTKDPFQETNTQKQPEVSHNSTSSYKLPGLQYSNPQQQQQQQGSGTNTSFSFDSQPKQTQSQFGFDFSDKKKDTGTSSFSFGSSSTGGGSSSSTGFSFGDSSTGGGSSSTGFSFGDDKLNQRRGALSGH